MNPDHFQVLFNIIVHQEGVINATLPIVLVQQHSFDRIEGRTVEPQKHHPEQVEEVHAIFVRLLVVPMILGRIVISQLLKLLNRLYSGTVAELTMVEPK